MNPGYRKRVIILLLAFLMVRFWFGQTFELSGREAYLWLEGHGTNLSPGYWERGPLVPFLIRVGTTFFGNTELGVRWLAAVIACLTGFTLFYLVRHWFNARPAFWTVVLFMAVPMFAWKLSFMTEATASIGLMALAMLAFCRATEEDKAVWWLLGGAACGLGMLVSIANAWWLGGLVLYFLVDPTRRLRLRDPQFWTMMILAVLCLAPLVWWWHGPQVADIRHTRLVNDFPLSHPFRFDAGFHFFTLELAHLTPLFAIALVVILVRQRAELWQDPRLALLVCLAIPGLAWENFASFFNEANFELVPALFLPLLLLAGCYGDRLAPEWTERARNGAWAVILIFAVGQSLVGIRSFYFTHDEILKDPISRRVGDEALAGLGGGVELQSWRTLADQMVQMQREVGANLIITDTPATASALSFYMPHHPSIYVEEQPDVVTQFDFWPHYTDAASSNDSALYLTRSTDDQAPADIVKNFEAVSALPDLPQAEFDKSWNMWNCQRFTGAAQPAPAIETSPMQESDSLPK